MRAQPGEDRLQQLHRVLFHRGDPLERRRDRGRPVSVQGLRHLQRVCPSGALSFQYPRVPELGQRVKTLLAEYARAGGTDACLLFHSAAAGSAAIARLARRGCGLPRG